METTTQTNWDAQDAAMDALYEGTLANFTEGSIVTGRIIRVHDGDVTIDIGYKSEGVIDANEFKDLEENPVGLEVDVFLERLEDDDGVIVISKKRAEQQKAWDYVVNECEEGSIVEGTIRSAVKGGFIVDVGVDAFLPGSQLDVTPVRNPEEYVDKTYEFRILKINLERKNIVVSRRDLIEESRRESRRKVLADIQVGQVRPGVVKNITDFGAFVDLDGIDGLLHVTDMTWGRINHPSEQLKVGDNLNVMVLDVDLEKERISLGLKQTIENPWEEIESRYPTGARVHGKVVNLAPYGAFIELEEGVEGLVHVSEMSWTKRVQRAADVLSLGDEVDAVVLSVSTEDKKISLGMRQTEENPWEIVAGKYPIGSPVTGKVRNFTTYGAFVEIEEGVDGLIHISQISDEHVEKVKDVLNVGDDIEARVVKVDATERRIGLSVKAAKVPDEEFEVEEDMLEGLQTGEELVNLSGAFDSALGDQLEEWHPGGPTAEDKSAE